MTAQVILMYLWWLSVCIYLALGLASPTKITLLNRDDNGVWFKEFYSASTMLVSSTSDNTDFNLANAYSVLFSSSAAKYKLVVHNNNVSGGEKLMAPNLRGVMAAPNRSEIKAKVLQIEQSSQFADKWYFELEILETNHISGPNFVRLGQKIKAFTVGEIPKLSPQSTLTAQAEFIGDQHGGQLQLTQINVTDLQ